MNSTSPCPHRFERAALIVVAASLLLPTLPAVAGASEPPASSPPSAAALQLLADHQAIEKLEWERRLWPEGNSHPKPSIEKLAPLAATRARVESELRQLTALESLWNVRLSLPEIQAELDRIAASTHDPLGLAQCFTALGNDPSRIAASLVRPLLVDHAMRHYFARDRKIHAATLEAAERGVRELRGGADPAALGAGDLVTTYRTEDRAAGGADEAATTVISVGDWSRLVRLLYASQRSATEQPGFAAEDDSSRLAALVDGGWSAPLELQGSIVTLRLLAHDSESLRVESLSWPKLSFDRWWSAARDQFAPSTAATVAGLRLPKIGAAASTSDSTTSGSAPTAPSSCPPEQWSEMRSTLPISREYHSAVWTGNEMIVWGGDEIDLLDQGEIWNSGTNSWRPVTRIGAPSPRSHHVAVWTGSMMIVWGGGSASGGRYLPGSDSWLPMTQLNAPPGGVGATAVWTGTEMIVWGGTPFSSGRYNPLSDSWAPIASAGQPTPRTGHTAVWAPSLNEMIIWGGAGALRSGGIYHYDTDSWSPTDQSESPRGRSAHTAVWTGSRMIVQGGIDSSGATRTDGSAYDPVTNLWSFSTIKGGPALHDHVSVWSTTTNEMLVIGSNDTNALAFGAMYNPLTNQWRDMSPVISATAGIGHTAVWTGNEMVVWGGSYAAGPNDDGGRFDPVTNSWTLLSYTGSPGDRSDEAAVYTGNEWSIWSGFELLEYWYDGGDYLPTLDAWRLFDLPAEARRGASAVWTGQSVLFWGGQLQNGNHLSNGAAHDPNAVGSTITYIGAPAGRSSHAAVWAHDRMLVWGGTGDSPGPEALDDGGRYDPVTDSWEPMSMLDAPSARASFASVSTGNKMIVWGGTVTSDGKIYDAVSDSWGPMSSSNAPAARSAPGSVWTGSEMLVWGGSAPGGGRYNPATDSWSPISNSGAPTTPMGAQVAWSADQHNMLVWGGGGGTPMPRTGAIYSADSDSWRPMSTSNAPTGRTSFSLAWDPHTLSMLVWGGSGPYSVESHSGGIYTIPPSAPINPFLNGQHSAPNTAHFYWPAIGSTYDLVRGALGTLISSGGDFTSSTQACLANDTSLTSLDDAAMPGSGLGFWYLLRGASCGGQGTYDSGSSSQIGLRDAEIAAASGSCP